MEPLVLYCERGHADQRGKPAGQCLIGYVKGHVSAAPKFKESEGEMGNRMPAVTQYHLPECHMRYPIRTQQLATLPLCSRPITLLARTLVRAIVWPVDPMVQLQRSKSILNILWDLVKVFIIF